VPLYTSGTTSTSFASFVTSTNSIMTPFNANGFGGNTSPNGTTYYRIFRVECFIRGDSGTVTPTFYIGTSAGSNNLANVGLSSVGTTFATRSAGANVAITSGTKYFAGHHSAGHQATRTNGGASGDFAGVFHGGSLASVTNASTSQTNFVLEYHGVPDQVTGVSASHTSGTNVTVSWTQPGGGGAAVRGYQVQRSLNGSTWTTIYDQEVTSTSITDTGASQGVTNFYRVSAFNNLRASSGTGITAALGPYSSSTSVAVPSATPAPVFSGSFANGTVGTTYTSAITSNNTTSTSLTASIPGLTNSHSASSGTGTFRIGASNSTERPTASGVYSVSASATGSGGTTNYSQNITINSPPTPSFSTNTFTSGKQGTSYSGSAITVSGTSGLQNITTSASSVAGLSISTTTSSVSLSGTPNQAGTFSFTATAYGWTNGGVANDTTATLSVTIAPIAPPEWIDTSLSTDFRVGQSYAVTSGGNTSVSASNSATFSVSSGSLPAGISAARSLSGTTAIYTLSGTPTARGPFSFALRASNTDGTANPDLSFSGNVTHPPLWVDETLGNFLQGRAYSDFVSVSTSTTVTWTVTGTVPAGITTAQSGTNTNTLTFSGTPTGSGSFSFTVQATNSDGILSKTFSGTILLVPNWIDNILGTFIQGIEYSDIVSATNSPTYAVTSGALPTGISLNSSTGAVTGTPTVLNQTFSFTITATNASGSISQAFSGSVQPDLGGGIKVFSGTAWDNKLIHAYVDDAWVEGTVFMFNGSVWAKSVF
jgi:hypothetical protein